MTARRSQGEQHRQTTVLLRSDILSRAREEGIDISDACNRALGSLLGIDYHQQTIPEGSSVRPVIIAKDTAAAGDRQTGHEPGNSLHPVMNAEDPSTPAKLKKIRKDGIQHKEVPETAAESPGLKSQKDRSAEERIRTTALLPPEKKRVQKEPPERKGKGDRIRKFLSKKILRIGEPQEGEIHRIPKDEMYHLFLRFSRGKDSSPVPDKRAFSVTLKTRFVLDEITVNGAQYWDNVKLR